MATKCRFRIVKLLNNDVFSKFGDLRGDFYTGTYEPKLFGMHIGSVLSGLEAGNVNSDHKMPKYDCEPAHWKGQKLCFFEVWRSWRGLL